MMIHGFLTSSKDFGTLPKEIEKYYDEVFLCTIPGHNENGNFKNFTVDATLEYVEKHFLQLRENFDIVDVYGFSMGGVLATHLASNFEIDNLILFAPANKFLNLSYLRSGFKLYYKTIKSTLAGSTKADRMKSIESALETYLANSKASVDMAIKKLIPNYSIHTLSTFTKLVKKVNEGLKPWKSRTCIFWGELDQLVPRNTIDFLSTYFIDAEHYVKVYDDVSHLMLLSKQAQKIIDPVINFIEMKNEFEMETMETFKKTETLKESFNKIVADTRQRNVKSIKDKIECSPEEEMMTEYDMAEEEFNKFANKAVDELEGGRMMELFVADAQKIKKYVHDISNKNVEKMNEITEDLKLEREKLDEEMALKENDLKKGDN